MVHQLPRPGPPEFFCLVRRYLLSDQVDQLLAGEPFTAEERSGLHTSTAG